MFTGSTIATLARNAATVNAADMWKILQGNCVDVLRTLSDQSVDCVVTSPPYFGLRDYNHDDQIGLEDSPAEFIARLIEVFSEVKRVMRDDGTCWVNIGDSYSNPDKFGGYSGEKNRSSGNGSVCRKKRNFGGLKEKDLIGVPWSFATAMRDDLGFYLRSDIIWIKTSVMPESVKDRPTKSHEHIFLFTKSARYHYNTFACRRPIKDSTKQRYTRSYHGNEQRDYPGQPQHFQRFRNSGSAIESIEKGANLWDVWEISSDSNHLNHKATFPREIPRRCIKLGCRENGLVLDPFCGSGTTLLAAEKLGRDSIGIELNPESISEASERIRSDTFMPLFEAVV